MKIATGRWLLLLGAVSSVGAYLAVAAAVPMSRLGEVLAGGFFLGAASLMFLGFGAAGERVLREPNAPRPDDRVAWGLCGVLCVLGLIVLGSVAPLMGWWATALAPMAGSLVLMIFVCLGD